MQFLHKILQFFKWSQTRVSLENPLNNLKFEEDGQFLTRQINRCTTFHGRSSEVQIALKHNERPLYNQLFMSENVNSFIFELQGKQLTIIVTACMCRAHISSVSIWPKSSKAGHGSFHQIITFDQPVVLIQKSQTTL